MNAERSLDIIVCTYSPDRLALDRMAKALMVLERPQGWQLTLTIIDNNSPEPVAVLQEVQDLLAAFNGRVIVETRQGIAYARQRGIAETSGPWILFFDDDNEPEPGYAAEAVRLIEKYPSVGIWGLGETIVDFTETPTDPYVTRRLDLLGQRKHGQMEFACMRGGWQRCYPPSMGMAIRREILQAYLARTQEGSLTAIGRQGRQVFSGEDTQMVFQCILMGYAAGRSPDMRLKHLIVGRKSTFSYLRQIAYGNGVNYAKAYYESYGEHIPEMHLPPAGQIRKDIANRIWRAVKNRQRRSLILELASYLGHVEGNYQAMGVDIPSPLLRLKKYLGFV